MNETEIDIALEQWAREMSDGGPGGYSTSPLDGNLALTETRNYRQRKGSIPMACKETRTAAKQEIRISPRTSMIDGIMLRIKKVDDGYYRALMLSYQRPNMRAVAAAMGIGYGQARQLRKAGFDMVCLMVGEK